MTTPPHFDWKREPRSHHFLMTAALPEDIPLNEETFAKVWQDISMLLATESSRDFLSCKGHVISITPDTGEITLIPALTDEPMQECDPRFIVEHLQLEREYYDLPDAGIDEREFESSHETLMRGKFQLVKNSLALSGLVSEGDFGGIHVWACEYDYADTIREL